MNANNTDKEPPNGELNNNINSNGISNPFPQKPKSTTDFFVDCCFFRKFCSLPFPSLSKLSDTEDHEVQIINDREASEGAS